MVLPAPGVVRHKFLMAAKAAGVAPTETAQWEGVRPQFSRPMYTFCLNLAMAQCFERLGSALIRTARKFAPKTTFEGVRCAQSASCRRDAPRSVRTGAPNTQT